MRAARSPAVGMSDEQPVTSPEFEGPDGVFDQIVVDARGGVAEAFAQGFFQTQEVFDGRGHGGLDEQLVDRIAEGPVRLAPERCLSEVYRVSSRP